MFTGIIEEVGRVKEFTSRQLTVSARQVLEGTAVGHSLAINGVCLTVTSLKEGAFTVEVMPETLRRTALGQLRPGDPLNLERALTPSSRLGGHLVEGHVDGTGRLLSYIPEERALLARYSAPREIRRYMVEKGFIAVDGVSLTVAQQDDSSFTVSLVSFTQEHTNLASRKPGDPVNLEVDIVAKYIAQYVAKLPGAESKGITVDFLAQHGFVKP